MPFNRCIRSLFSGQVITRIVVYQYFQCQGLEVPKCRRRYEIPKIGPCFVFGNEPPMASGVQD